MPWAPPAHSEAQTVNRMLRRIEEHEHLVPAEMPASVEVYLNQKDGVRGEH